MYTPAEEYEVKVTREFIHEIQKKMLAKAGPNVDKEPVSMRFVGITPIGVR